MLFRMFLNYFVLDEKSALLMHGKEKEKDHKQEILFLNDIDRNLSWLGNISVKFSKCVFQLASIFSKEDKVFSSMIKLDSKNLQR